jgi:hypothetical protein
MSAKQFYKEHLEGEPLTHESVIWGLDEYALTKTLSKDKIIEIIEGMGFNLVLDKFDAQGQFMRFELKNHDLDEKDLRMIWYKEYTLLANFSSLANIIFKAGQKLSKIKFNTLENICED